MENVGAVVHVLSWCLLIPPTDSTAKQSYWFELTSECSVCDISSSNRAKSGKIHFSHRKLPNSLWMTFFLSSHASNCWLLLRTEIFWFAALYILFGGKRRRHRDRAKEKNKQSAHIYVSRIHTQAFTSCKASKSWLRRTNRFNWIHFVSLFLFFFSFVGRFSMLNAYKRVYTRSNKMWGWNRIQITNILEGKRNGVI